MIRKDAINLIGHKVGQLTVVSFSGRDKNRSILWNCRCECGAFCTKLGKRLISKKTQSCGCKRQKNLVGKKFGYWLVLKGIPNGRRKKWRCRCICGAVKDVCSSSLYVNKSSSCGCKNIPLTLSRGKIGAFNGTHHLTAHPLYRVYHSMKNRCYNSKQQAFPWYGGRGITVCDQWKRSFKVFYDWAINTGYQSGLTIDRICSKKSYSPENCRWVTRAENSSRATGSKHLEKIFNGWKYIERISFTTHAIFECVKCGFKKQVNSYFITSGRAGMCKCNHYL